MRRPPTSAAPGRAAGEIPAAAGTADGMIRCEQGELTPPQMAALERAWARAAGRVPLATSCLTLLRPYRSAVLAGKYHWEASGFTAVDIGVPGPGSEGGPVTREFPSVRKTADHSYFPARRCFPRTMTEKLADRWNGGEGAALAAQQWDLWPSGTHNLEAFLVHELAHGQWYEALHLIPDFKEKMYAAVAAALGVPAIDPQILPASRKRRDLREAARADHAHLDIRLAVAGELGLNAARLPLLKHSWNELWPSFVTAEEFAPQAGPVSKALQPLREEIAAIPPDRQRLYLYGRLNARAMRPGDLGLLERERPDLCAVALARAGRLGPRETADLAARARDRGVELDTAYLKTAQAGARTASGARTRPARDCGRGGPELA